MTGLNRYGRNLLIFLFAVSGFAGLIYESIWSHYLKLFLGHAAYAQTLVLAIFMGGMAIGATLASRYSGRWKNLLLIYALIEGVIGVCAMLFHGVFVATTDLAYGMVIPGLGSPWAVNLFKWTLAAGLILPQSILLGATFPLMSAGLIRRFPTKSGGSLAILYFTNSLGAAIGVLASGFVLTDLVGLPGTILTAGLINIGLALFVWLLVRNSVETPAPGGARKAGAKAIGSWRIMLLASLLTGAASFMYEIGWIRMLSLVLGSATHSFELMLSAFIFGLAFGGLWMYRRIDRLKQPLRFLGLIQIIMGLLALATLVAYNASFDLMRAMIQALTPTPAGYSLFNLGSHAIALGIMLPATFCAGVTLPLITHLLLRQGHGEKSIGAVYAANTVGAIAGIFFAVHIGLPFTGIKGLITIGAVIDMALGVVLLRMALVNTRSWTVPVAAMLSAAAVITTLVGVELDRYKMASGVYRLGQLLLPGTAEVLYHQDGKTATVDLVRQQDGAISIRTNGKPDAQISFSPDGLPSADESTMILAAVIPLALNPQARTAANIGLGSGLTTHILLRSPILERVDTIEIEPAMVQAARGFGARVELAFTDARSRIYIDDAKAFFASHGHRYDIILSEPSNPWVSGVAGLYSDEFYRRIRTHLNPKGLFVQWIQVYEIDVNLVASVIKAIGNNFVDYAVYGTNDGDLMVVARADGPLPQVDTRVLSQPGLEKELKRIGILTPQDFALRRIGDRALLEPLFGIFPMPANSDYFPVLDLNAVRARFLRSSATELAWLAIAPLPILDMLDNTPVISDTTPATPSRELARSERAHIAAMASEFYSRDSAALYKLTQLDAKLARHMVVVSQFAQDCRKLGATALWLDSVSQVAVATLPHLRPQQAQPLWHHWQSSDCYARLTPVQADSIALFRAVAQRNATQMATYAERLLRTGAGTGGEQGDYILGAGMLGYLTQHRPQEAQRLWTTYAPQILGNRTPVLALRMLWAHSMQPAKLNVPLSAHDQPRTR